ncbi:D-alanyl-D-alanine carboxypeptidase/D-alanyl-D-alanine-endopeptidase [Naumannella sp. ID2617S]|uniref:D-alanyl-D-alanine carboxypeptidase/D-alanyl-D-alanine-endopeptidase n=1 Tax=Enemella dayhoffiae TaxID=2016507 RepID=A0A255H9Z5_9ACTN|nr:D-alanyl-D-alanine carboxypeptidase/D-alanyl-D-alanine-endopeptidase [Enemella dayhoffiae]NNG20869.1 D-alanyl-D-alanine carboxypeptidase/D-alanyl-D-alanine-endopeptidase [Naumannella sp. ID2617S]OYO24116.1 D-alanyl-D-alanine carboxypeptidase/D-alanyl-D-alanine-endopeptidase [Enemella dayhoffiae]
MPTSPSAKLMLRSGLLVLVIVLIVLGLATGLIQSTARRGLYATGLWVDGGASTIDPSIFDRDDGPAALPPKPAAPVLPESSPQPGSNPARVAERINAVGPVGGRMLGRVVDVASGQELYAREATGAGTPASTLKTLTSLAALEAYGPAHRFRTTVRRDSANPGRVYLVGGGDPYLLAGEPVGGNESVLTLARRTAEALQTAGPTGPVEVVTDASYFGGPTWNPEWIPAYHDYVADTTALWVNGARRTNNSIGPREADPPRAAGNVFANELRRLGVPVTTVSAGVAPQPAAEVAGVDSLPLENIVEEVLIHSDNDAAEVLFRHVGRSGGRGGSLADAQAASREILTRLGAWSEGMRQVDGSGLARSNLVSPTALTRAVQLGVAPDQPKFRALATGMSVAGVEGTLGGRFVEEGTAPGRGLVRAKTGTLTQVHTLAGYVRDADGALLAYSFIVNGDPDDYGTRVWLDRVTAAVASCGCR